MSSSTHASIHTHPDILALRERYDRAAEQPIAQVVEGLMLLSGLYAAASAWIVGFAGQTNLSVTNLICGVAIGLLAVAFGAAYGRTHGMTFVTPLLGIWLIVSPWIVAGVDTSTSMIWSNVIVGALVCVFGIATAALGIGRGPQRREQRQETR
ncbi:SPW repeat protein [Rhodococcus qingshengii]|uniref:SPW repeat protein n=1 Tax=Rhodococcus qingshengii TaxID=334542 RepID=UPI001BE67874|nr:SPW repeat protein [Rhodococcus qingshengii]MBT2274150.1 SPW repeat protein [Rhodococcus qingshengii]